MKKPKKYDEDQDMGGDTSEISFLPDLCVLTSVTKN
jgi:hypothetical protein